MKLKYICSVIWCPLSRATFWRRWTKLNSTACTLTVWRYKGLQKLQLGSSMPHLGVDFNFFFFFVLTLFQDSMFERLQFRSVTDQQSYLQDEGAFLTDYLQSHGQHAEKPTVEYLQQLARVRVDLDMTADLIVGKLRAKGVQFISIQQESFECVNFSQSICIYFIKLYPVSPEGGQNRATAFLDSVVNLCRRSGNDWYRVYLIRKISSHHGVEFVKKLLKRDQMRWLFPEEVQQQVQFDFQC